MKSNQMIKKIKLLIILHFQIYRISNMKFLINLCKAQIVKFQLLEKVKR